jgi:hypothetical protein
MTVLSLPGLFLLYRRDVNSWVIAMSCLMVFPLIHYIIQFEYRYRYPILWVTFLLGALAIRAGAESILKVASLRIHKVKALVGEIIPPAGAPLPAHVKMHGK